MEKWFPWLRLWFRMTWLFDEADWKTDHKASFILALLILAPFVFWGILKWLAGLPFHPLGFLDGLVKPHEHDLSTMNMDEVVEDHKKNLTERKICFNCRNYDLQTGTCDLTGRKIGNPDNSSCDMGFDRR